MLAGSRLTGVHTQPRQPVGAARPQQARAGAAAAAAAAAEASPSRLRRRLQHQRPCSRLASTGSAEARPMAADEGSTQPGTAGAPAPTAAVTAAAAAAGPSPAATAAAAAEAAASSTRRRAILGGCAVAAAAGGAATVSAGPARAVQTVSAGECLRARATADLVLHGCLDQQPARGRAAGRTARALKLYTHAAPHPIQHPHTPDRPARRHLRRGLRARHGALHRRAARQRADAVGAGLPAGAGAVSLTFFGGGSLTGVFDRKHVDQRGGCLVGGEGWRWRCSLHCSLLVHSTAPAHSNQSAKTPHPQLRRVRAGAARAAAGNLRRAEGPKGQAQRGWVVISGW
jgi:hypothetical protein